MVRRNYFLSAITPDPEWSGRNCSTGKHKMKRLIFISSIALSAALLVCVSLLAIWFFRTTSSITPAGQEAPAKKASPSYE